MITVAHTCPALLIAIDNINTVGEIGPLLLILRHNKYRKLSNIFKKNTHVIRLQYSEETISDITSLNVTCEALQFCSMIYPGWW